MKLGAVKVKKIMMDDDDVAGAVSPVSITGIANSSNSRTEDPDVNINNSTPVDPPGPTGNLTQTEYVSDGTEFTDIPLNLSTRLKSVSMEETSINLETPLEIAELPIEHPSVSSYEGGKSSDIAEILLEDCRGGEALDNTCSDVAESQEAIPETPENQLENCLVAEETLTVNKCLPDMSSFNADSETNSDHLGTSKVEAEPRSIESMDSTLSILTDPVMSEDSATESKQAGSSPQHDSSTDLLSQGGGSSSDLITKSTSSDGTVTELQTVTVRFI